VRNIHCGGSGHGPWTRPYGSQGADPLGETQSDAIEVEREVAKADSLATEPLTIAVTLLTTAPLIVAVGRIIERWMENRNQLKHLNLVAEGFEISDKAGKVLADVAKAHAKVSIEYRLPTAPNKHKPGGPKKKT
jgi:hypothetical protein